MKGFLKLLIAGLFLVSLGFVTEQPINSIDDDVGISISVDVDQNIATFENFEMNTSLSYQEVGIVPTLNFDIISVVEIPNWYCIEVSQGDNLNENYYMEGYSSMNIGKLQNESFQSNSPEITTIAKIKHNISKEVSGLMSCYNPEITEIII